MNTVGSNQNCQLKSTRRNTVRSHVVFRDSPRRRTAQSFSSSVRKRADLWCGRSGMANQPGRMVNVTGAVMHVRSGAEDTTLLTKKGKRNGHNRHNDEHPPPRRQGTLSTEGSKQGSLDPPSGHVAQVTKATEDGGSGPKLGLLIPRAIYEMRSDAEGLSAPINSYPGRTG